MMIDTATGPTLVDRQWNPPGSVPGRLESRSPGVTDATAATDGGPSDQAAFLKQMASRLGADPTDSRARTPEGLARLGAERMVSIALIEPMVREAREASASTGMFAPGPGEKRFGHMLDRDIADSIVASPNFGGVVALERRLLDRINLTLGIQEPAADVSASAGTETRS
ncbi:MAG: hypothetical protein GY895_00175 [Phycisphaera sp.]|nr:hypothetical protein [Phycisphaera sp.]